MTTTDVAGLPGEIRAQLARARISQEVACDAAGLPRTTYYQRVRQPGSWRVRELRELADQAGADLVVTFGSIDLDTHADAAITWRLAELETLARALGLELRIELRAHEVMTLGPVASDG